MSRTVIFDFDGTIADSIAVAVDIYNQLAPKMGALPITLEEIPELRKLSYKEILKKKKLNWFRLPWAMNIVPKKMKMRIKDIKPYPGMPELMADLLSSGYRVGVLSSNQQEFLDQYFEEHRLPKLSFVVSERTLFGKDKALKRIMKKYGLNQDQVVYVGDEPRDIEAARKAGVESVGVTWGLGGREALATQNPDNYADTPEELKKLLIS